MKKSKDQPVTIEIATKRDIDDLTALLHLLFEQETEFSPNPDKQKKGLQTILDDPNVGEIIVSKINDNIIGMVILLNTISTALGGKVAILEDMIVHPKFRRIGIGKLLIKHAIQRAKELECLRITLLTDDDNFIAHRFYQHQNFRRSSMTAYRFHIDK